MPRGNGTGPNGMGPMTGRGAGNCGGVRNGAEQGFGAGKAAGFGYGAGCGTAGRGRGFRNRQAFGMPGAPEPADQESFLTTRIGMLSKALDEAQKTLAKLKDESHG